MPVRLLTSSILKWPESSEVLRALDAWASEVAQQHSTVIRIGYFGSCAVGTWGCGSDLDLIVVVGDSSQPFERRSIEFDTTKFPVPVDLLVYTLQEWERLNLRDDGRHASKLGIIWVYERNEVKSWSA